MGKCKDCRYFDDKALYCRALTFATTNDFEGCTQFVPKEDSTAVEIEKTLDSMKHLLVEKNKRYGDSALKPMSIFCRMEAAASIQVRLDDKISRIRNSEVLRKNDVADVIGYLTLLCVAKGWTNFDELID